MYVGVNFQMIEHVLKLPSNEHDCSTALSEVAEKLWDYASKLKNVACASTIVELILAALDICPLGHEDHTDFLCNLSGAFVLCYEQKGSVSDLNKAVDLAQIRLDLCPLGHSDHINALRVLVFLLMRHYGIQKNNEDLNRLIELQERWVDLCPLDYSGHSHVLGELAESLCEHYEVQGNIADLNRAIAVAKRELDLHPDGQPCHNHALNSSARSMYARYQKLGDLKDLDRCIDLQKKSLELTPLGHLEYRTFLQAYAFSLLERSKKMENHSDLSEAARLFKEALGISPVHHTDFAFNAAQLAATTLLLSNHSQGSDTTPPHSVDDAFQTYGLLKRCSPAISLELLKATLGWIQDAEKYSHPSALEAYQTSFDTLDHFTSLSSSITIIVEDRYDNIQPSIVVQGLLSLLSAAAAAVEYTTMSRNSNCLTDPYTPTLDKQYLLNFGQISQVIFFSTLQYIPDYLDTSTEG